MKTLKKKVLFFSTLQVYPFWEGSEKFWYSFVQNENVRKRLNCHIALSESTVTRERGKLLEALGLTTSYYVPDSHNFFRRNVHKISQKIGFSQKNYAYWYKLIEKLAPTLVWFNVDYIERIASLSFATQLCQSNNIPYWIILQLSPEQYFIEDENEAAIFISVLKNAKKVIFVSERNRLCVEKAVGLKLDNSFRSVNGLTAIFISKAEQVSKESPVSNCGTARFFSLARLSPIAKGHHILFEVLAAPKWRERDWKLRIIGGGDPSLLKRLISYFKLDAEKVSVEGKVSDVLPIIENSDLLIMPSLMEGTPFSMVEAMACGRPAVGTPVGGIPELIIEGKTGWISESVEVNHFAEALERAWQARDSWRQIGESARKLINVDYNENQFVEKLLSAMLDDIGE